MEHPLRNYKVEVSESEQLCNSSNFKSQIGNTGAEISCNLY